MGTHPREDRYEARRSFRLQALGYRVIRFSDMDETDNLSRRFFRARRAVA